MTEEQEIALLANVKSITDRMDLVDAIIKSEKLGQPKVLAFRCGHSGLYLPPDYVKEWGRLYGIGLGPNPVSEVLDSDYHTAPAAINEAIRSFDQVMHPVGNSFAQVDSVLVPAEEAAAAVAICAKDDPYMEARIHIVRARQDVNPMSKRKILRVAWVQAGRKV